MTKENFNSTHTHRERQREGEKKGERGAETEKQVLASMI